MTLFVNIYRDKLPTNFYLTQVLTKEDKYFTQV